MTLDHKFPGEGHFIGKDGKISKIHIPEPIELPADALPSEFELERNLQAITISEGDPGRLETFFNNIPVESHLITTSLRFHGR